MPELLAQEISFSYAGEKPVFYRCSLQVKTGERILIRGRNACGKSTLLKTLSGMYAPSNGVVAVHGTPTADLRLETGLLFQNPEHQMIAETVEDEIALGLELRGVPQPEMVSRVEEIIERFRLQDLCKKTTRGLSGGQKQRVALAAIMVARPSFLLFDEPESHLDAPCRRDFLSLVDEIANQVGIVWTASRVKGHSKYHRVYEMHDGSLVEVENRT